MGGVVFLGFFVVSIACVIGMMMFHARFMEFVEDKILNPIFGRYSADALVFTYPFFVLLPIYFAVMLGKEFGWL